MAELQIERSGETTTIVRPRNLGLVVGTLVGMGIFVLVIHYVANYRASLVSNMYDQDDLTVAWVVIVTMMILFAIPIVLDNVAPQRLTISDREVGFSKWGFRHTTIPWDSVETVRTLHNRRYAFTPYALAQRRIIIEVAGRGQRIRLGTSSNSHAWTLDNIRTVAFTLMQRARMANASIIVDDAEGLSR